MVEDTKAQPKSGSLGRSLLALLLILGLLGAVAWLVAERNARQWFLVPEDGQLVVKKGVPFLIGRAGVKPGDDVAAEAYAPVRPPPGGALPAEREFDDRLALEQGIYEVLVRWAQGEISSEDPQRLEGGLLFLARAEKLRGISETQRDELRRLRGESGFFEARTLLERGAEALRLAREKLRLAAASPTRQAAAASLLLRQLDPLVEQAFVASRAAAAAPRAQSGSVPAAPQPGGATR
jgi:hypothetical protein